MKNVQLKSDSSDVKMGILQHLGEIRRRLIFVSLAFIIVFIVSFIYAKNIYLFLIYPLQNLTKDHSVQLIYTALQEAFLTYVKLAFFSSVMIILPFLFSQLWLFISPALYDKEKKIFRLVFILSPILFWLGAITAYLWVIPSAWKFFLGFEVMRNDKNIAITLLPKVNEYLSLSLHLIMAFAVIFLLPIFMFGLVKLGMLNIVQIKKYRRYAIVAAFVIAAIATPPDPFSQVIMAVVIILLYEFSLILVKISNINSTVINESTDDKQ